MIIMVVNIDTQIVNAYDDYYGKNSTPINNIYFSGQIEKDMGYDIIGERQGKTTFQTALKEFAKSGVNRRTYRTIANINGVKREVVIYVWHPTKPFDRIVGLVCYPNDLDAVRNAKRKQSQMDGIL